MTGPGQWSVTPATPPTLGLFPEAERLYANQAGWPQYFPTSTYAPLTSGQTQAINQITGFGEGGGTPALQSADTSLSSILGQGTAATSGAFGQGQDYLSSMLSGAGGAGSSTLDAGMAMMPGYASLLGQGGNTLASLSSLLPQYNQNYAGGAGSLGTLASPMTTAMGLPAFGQAQGALGGYLSPGYTNPYTNPGFQSLVNNTLAQVIPATSASFTQGGRSDSGLAQRAQTMAATDAVGQLAANQYNQNVAQQQNAIGQAGNQLGMLGGLQSGAAQALMSGGLTGTGLVGTAGGNLGQLGLGGIGQAQGAAGTAGALQQGAAQLAGQNFLNQQGNLVKGAAVAPTIDASTLQDLTTALGAQGINQQDQQAAINAAIQKWNFQQQQPWSMLQQYQNVVGGTGFGSQNQSTGTTTTPSNSNTAANLISGTVGGAALGGGLASAIPALGITGPGGLAAGAGVGLLASLLGNR
jgi:hypothetical protein